MTKAERRRFEILKTQIGCIACGNPVICNAHHLLSGGRRRGHMETIPLCQPCHVGDELSIHRTKRKFCEIYGTDDELLERTNALIGQFEASIVGKC